MKDGWSHLGKTIGRALCACALADYEGMRYVGGVVYTESDADDKEDANEGIN